MFIAFSIISHPFLGGKPLYFSLQKLDHGTVGRRGGGAAGAGRALGGMAGLAGGRGMGFGWMALGRSWKEIAAGKWWEMKSWGIFWKNGWKWIWDQGKSEVGLPNATAKLSLNQKNMRINHVHQSRGFSCWNCGIPLVRFRLGTEVVNWL